MTDPTPDATTNAVDHLATGIKAISEAVSKVAPHAWEIAVYQQRLEGYRDLIAGVFFAALFAYGALHLWRARPNMLRNAQAKEKKEIPTHPCRRCGRGHRRAGCTCSDPVLGDSPVRHRRLRTLPSSRWCVPDHQRRVLRRARSLIGGSEMSDSNIGTGTP